MELLASEIHENPGAGLALRGTATPRIAHNAFSRNGKSEQAASAVLIELGARPTFQQNVFHGLDPFAVAILDDGTRAQLRNETWFPGVRPPQPASPARTRGPNR